MLAFLLKTCLKRGFLLKPAGFPLASVRFASKKTDKPKIGGWNKKLKVPSKRLGKHYKLKTHKVRLSNFVQWNSISLYYFHSHQIRGPHNDGRWLGKVGPLVLRELDAAALICVARIVHGKREWAEREFWPPNNSEVCWKSCYRITGRIIANYKNIIHFSLSYAMAEDPLGLEI
jgi:hypothetical protein